jgi:hypothetical protein
MKKYNFPQVQHEVVRLRGGLDLITPTLDLKPGVLRDSVNWEVSTTGGYSRIAGYERYDGRPNPSDAAFATITLSAIGTLAVGDTVNGQTSGATGVIIAIVGTEVVYTKATGTFQVGENAREGVAVQGTVVSLSAVSTSAQLTAQYSALAADAYRADIAAIPGSGPTRGVAYYNGVVYGWRNNAGGTALDMYKSTSGGWSLVSLGIAVQFNTGVGEIFDGNTVTGLTSGASGVVTRVIKRSGAWGTTAAGTLVFASITGAFVNGESLRVGGVTKATSTSASAAQTMLPGGRVITDQAAVSGGASGKKLYGADGVNNAFEFDGTSFVKITTGMTADQPLLCKVHKNHLFLTFNASLQHSGLGLPYEWTVLVGAGELAMQGSITALSTLPGSNTTAALAIYSGDSTAVLYGTSSADWNLATYNNGTGAIAYSNQVLSAAYVFDNRGVIELSASQNYGNFTDATLTNNIRPFIQGRRNIVTGSVVNREKSQYRIFFSDGYGLYITINNGKLLGCMPVSFPDHATVACEGETPDGQETAFFGGAEGYVFRLDAGTSFDGETISASMFFNYNPQRDSRTLKSYKRGSLEITGSGYAEVSIGYDLAYSDAARVDQQAGLLYANSFIAPFWDSFVWDAFVWDGISLGPTDIEIRGTAENIAVRIDCNGNYFHPFTINSLILHFIQRRGLR